MLAAAAKGEFPFLFGGTFIEAYVYADDSGLLTKDFPSFSEGLSLRRLTARVRVKLFLAFPFLFGGTFIEARDKMSRSQPLRYFPSFSEGLSLRQSRRRTINAQIQISLPFRRDFH